MPTELPRLFVLVDMFFKIILDHTLPLGSNPCSSDPQNNYYICIYRISWN